MSFQDDLIKMHAPGTMQDINDPIWPSEPVEAPGYMEHVGEEMEVRTIHGPLDLLQRVESEVFDMANHSTRADLAKEFTKQYRPSLPVAMLPSENWAARTYQVDRVDVEIAPIRSDRLRVVVRNVSANPILLSHNTIASPTGSVYPPTGVITLAANSEREFRTRGKIYAHPNVIGTPQQVDVQDEFGVIEWE